MMKNILKRHIDKILAKVDYQTLCSYLPKNFSFKGKTKSEIIYELKKSLLDNDRFLIRFYKDNKKKIALSPKEVDAIWGTSPLDRKDLLSAGYLVITHYEEFKLHNTENIITYPMYDYVSVYSIDSKILKDTKENIKLKNDFNKFEDIINDLNNEEINIFNLLYFIWRISKIRLNYILKLKNARTKMYQYEQSIDKWSKLESDGLFLLYKKYPKLFKINKNINRKKDLPNQYCFSIKIGQNMLLHLILEEKYCGKFPPLSSFKENNKYFYEKLYIFNVENFKFNIQDIHEDKIEELFWKSYHVVE